MISCCEVTSAPNIFNLKIHPVSPEQHFSHNPLILYIISTLLQCAIVTKPLSNSEVIHIQ